MSGLEGLSEGLQITSLIHKDKICDHDSVLSSAGDDEKVHSGSSSDTNYDSTESEFGQLIETRNKDVKLNR